MKKINSEIGSLAPIRDGSGPASWGESVWHTGDIKKYPVAKSDFVNIEKLITEYCLDSMPEKPVLDDNGNVVAIGSCFAAELRHFLGDAGLSSDSFWIPSGLNNTFALRDFFHWAVYGKETAKGFAYTRDDNGSLVDWQPELEQKTIKKAISEASCFVFTLGLAEVWEDKDTSRVFWRGVPEHIFESGRHQFRMSTVAENSENLASIVQIIREVNKNAPIVFTLSPVPLKATFSGKSCITADCVSKSTLRVAINEYMSTLDDYQNIWYWPSFEIIKWVGCHLPYPVYGTDDGCVRHVSRFMVNNILKSFVRTFYGSSVAENVFAKFESSLQTIKGEQGEPPVIFKGQIVKG